MNKDMTCRGMQFEIGKTYHVDGNVELCSNGLHFCKNLRDTFIYYEPGKSRFFEVDASGETETDGTKYASSTLTVVRELSAVEINRSFYGYGDGNGDGYGDVYGDGNGYGNGNGYGDGYGKINQILNFND